MRDTRIEWWYSRAFFERKTIKDIDKLYLLAITLTSNGNLQAGTSLQKYIGFKHAIQLPKARNINYIETTENADINLSQNLVAEFGKHTKYWTESTKDKFVYFMNQINKLGLNEVKINFINKTLNPEEFNIYKTNILNLLKKHAETPSYIKDSEETLKTRVFMYILQSTTSAQNQLKAQIAVDFCTKELKKRAESTSGANAEKEVTSWNPASIFTMQEQNMLGKAVVGIGAVSLKSYFILSTYYNRMAQQLTRAIQNNDFKNAGMYLAKLTITLPDGKKTTLANTNLNGAIRAAKNKVGFENIYDLLLTLKKNTAKISAPEFLSGIISLAADFQ